MSSSAKTAVPQAPTERETPCSSNSQGSGSFHDVVQQHVVVEEMRGEPLGVLGLLRLLLPGVELGEGLQGGGVITGHHQEDCREEGSKGTLVRVMKVHVHRLNTTLIRYPSYQISHIAMSLKDKKSSQSPWKHVQ